VYGETILLIMIGFMQIFFASGIFSIALQYDMVY
jgi:hypothetical protein